MAKKLELKDLLEAGAHFGHQTHKWNPKMKPYVFGERNGIYVIDLQQTVPMAQKAYEFIKKTSSAGKSVLFVGTKRQASPIIRAEAERIGAFYVASRWAGGTISNWKQVKKSIKRLIELKEGLKTGKFDKYTKKERVILDREMGRLERIFGGIADLQSPPDALFIVDTGREKAAFREAKKYGIKVFAVVDSNANPDGIDYVIPGNDDAVRSIKLLVKTFADAVAEGMEMAKKQVVRS